MNELLKDILLKKIVNDEKGNSYALNSHTSQSQGEVLQKVIFDIKPAKTLEIGLAYGISSLFICEAISMLKNTKHIIIDPGTNPFWKDIGLLNLKRADYYKLVEYYKGYSYDVLPELYKKGEKIQFAYIDSTKLLDVLFADFLYIDKILDVGGVIVFDDCCYESVKSLVRYINCLPSYELFLVHQKSNFSSKRRIYNKFVNCIFSLIPFKKVMSYPFNLSLDNSLNLDYHCIGFKKISIDQRNWDWFERF